VLLARRFVKICPVLSGRVEFVWSCIPGSPFGIWLYYTAGWGGPVKGQMVLNIGEFGFGLEEGTDRADAESAEFTNTETVGRARCPQAVFTSLRGREAGERRNHQGHEGHQDITKFVRDPEPRWRSGTDAGRSKVWAA
jgi:hypothetical protein